MFAYILAMIVGSAAIIGNSLVCHIILHSKFVKKTAFNYVLLNLAILDVITSILAVYKALLDGPLYVEGKGDGIMRVYNQSYVGAEIMCKIKQSFWIGSRVTPALLLVIAYERYKAIVTPLCRRSGEFSPGNLKLAIGFSWILGVFPYLFFMVSRKVTYEGCHSINADWFDPSVYTIMSVALCFLIPTVVMSVLYFKVIKVIKRDEQLGVQAAAQRARKAARRKVIVIIITVTILFYVFCGFPHLAYITSSVFTFELWSDSVQTLLYTINSVTNPVVYFIFLKPFRMGLRSLFKCNTSKNFASNFAIINHNSMTIQFNSSKNVISLQRENNVELLNVIEISSTLQIGST